VKAVKRWVGEGGKVTLGGPDRVESTDGLASETHGHVIIAGCEGMATTV